MCTCEVHQARVAAVTIPMLYDACGKGLVFVPHVRGGGLAEELQTWLHQTHRFTMKGHVHEVDFELV